MTDNLTKARPPRKMFAVLLLMVLAWSNLYHQDEQADKEIAKRTSFIEQIHRQSRANWSELYTGNRHATALYRASAALASVLEYDWRELPEGGEYLVLLHKDSSLAERALNLLDEANAQPGHPLLTESSYHLDKLLESRIEDALSNSDPARANQFALARVKLTKRTFIGDFKTDYWSRLDQLEELVSDLEELPWMTTELRDEVAAIIPHLKPVLLKNVKATLHQEIREFGSRDFTARDIESAFGENLGPLVNLGYHLGFDLPIKLKYIEYLDQARDVLEDVETTETSEHLNCERLRKLEKRLGKLAG